MIKIEKANEKIKNKLNIVNEAFICADNDNILGFCEYKTNENFIFIENVEFKDKMIADGLIRQTMNYCLDQGYNICKYSEKAKEVMFSVKILKNLEQSQIDILEFFLKLNCC